VTPSRRFYYGWNIAYTLALTELVSWGILYYAFSVMLTPMQREFGWDSGALTGAFSLALLVSGLAAFPVGRWLDRYGARIIITAGSCAGVALVLAWSQVTTIAGFYLIWLLIGLTTALVLYEPAFTVIANWFIRKRARALTVLTFGGGLASVVFVPLTEWLSSTYGWRPDGETRSLEAAPSPPESSVSARAAVCGSAFWWLALAFTLSTFASLSITVHLIPYLTGRGFSASFAAAALGLIGGSQIPGRLLFTPLGERFSRRLLTAALFAMQAAALLILIAVPTETGVILFAIIFGSGAGASSPARAALLAELYGAAHYGSISGAQTLDQGLCAADAAVMRRAV
jgi:MFS family permease